MLSELGEKEIAVQLYLHLRESENGYFQLKLIGAKRINKQAFIKLKRPISSEIFDMTPQEELFASFFNNERALVKDMDPLSLEAHREELSRIAFEARARLTAVDEEKRSRKVKTKGFQAAIHVDELATNAINKVAERGKRLSKEEKLIENMMKLPGMDRKTAEMLISAGTVKAQLDSKFGKSDKPVEENKPFSASTVSPFAKPEPPKAEVVIQEETNTVIITEAKEEEKKPAFSFANPFAK